MLVINNPMSKLLTRPGQLKLGKVELDKDVNKKKKMQVSLPQGRFGRCEHALFISLCVHSYLHRL